MMALFSKLFGATGKSNSVVLQHGNVEREIVGESFYQPSLSKLAGGKTVEGVEIEAQVILRPEPDNQYDSNAVRVEIGTLLVGYLSKSDALTYLQKIGDCLGHCNAQIVGGWDRGEHDTGHFGVKLNVKWPPEA